MLIVHMSSKHYLNGFSVFIYRGTSSAANMLPRYPSCRPEPLGVLRWGQSAQRFVWVTQVPTWALDKSQWRSFFFPFSDFISACVTVWGWAGRAAMLRHWRTANFVVGPSGRCLWISATSGFCFSDLLCKLILKSQYFWYQTCLFYLTRKLRRYVEDRVEWQELLLLLM